MSSPFYNVLSPTQIVQVAGKTEGTGSLLRHKFCGLQVDILLVDFVGNMTDKDTSWNSCRADPGTMVTPRPLARSVARCDDSPLMSEAALLSGDEAECPR